MATRKHQSRQVNWGKLGRKVSRHPVLTSVALAGVGVTSVGLYHAHRVLRKRWKRWSERNAKRGPKAEALASKIEKQAVQLQRKLERRVPAYQGNARRAAQRAQLLAVTQRTAQLAAQLRDLVAANEDEVVPDDLLLAGLMRDDVAGESKEVEQTAARRPEEDVQPSTSSTQTEGEGEEEGKTPASSSDSDEPYENPSSNASSDSDEPYISNNPAAPSAAPTLEGSSSPPPSPVLARAVGGVVTGSARPRFSALPPPPPQPRAVRGTSASAAAFTRSPFAFAPRAVVGGARGGMMGSESEEEEEGMTPIDTTTEGQTTLPDIERMENLFSSKGGNASQGPPPPPPRTPLQIMTNL